jgi:hypothetical protein
MKHLITLVAACIIASTSFSQTISFQVHLKSYEDQALFTGEKLNSGSSVTDCYYSFNLNRKILTFENKQNGISKTCKILDYSKQDGVITIVYKDISKYNPSNVYFPQVTIDTNNKHVSMVFVELPRKLIGIDNYTYVDIE